MQSARVEYIKGGFTGSRTVAGFMRLREWGLAPEGVVRWIESALEMGVTTFDHADIYGGYTCEGEFGKALSLSPKLRDRIEIVTKCGIQLVTPNRPDTYVHHYNTTREHIVWSVNNSLKELQTDRIDLLLIHRPDPLMDADAVADALHEVLRAGKVLHVGVSNFTPFQFDLLQSRLNFPLETNQIELSPVHLDPLHDGTLDQLQRLRIKPQIWSPVGGGGFMRGEDVQARRLLETMGRIAQAHGGAGIDQIALAFVMAHPTTPIPVVGTGKLERLRAAVHAETIHLERQEWFAIWQASNGYEVP